MKKIFTIICLLVVITTVKAQENKLSIIGGYVFSNIEDTDADAKGWRINGLYEFTPNASSLSHGIALGYMTTNADYTSLTESTNYDINSWPIYYVPKFTVGKGNLKGFVKGALGTHISTYKRTGTLTEIKSTDMGFYGGAGLGGTLNINEKVYLQAEYEWAYMSNTIYVDGFINSFTAGLGFKF
jgi:hypothetical protein